MLVLNSFFSCFEEFKYSGFVNAYLDIRYIVIINIINEITKIIIKI